jgi:hypothetical protein
MPGLHPADRGSRTSPYEKSNVRPVRLIQMHEAKAEVGSHLSIIFVIRGLPLAL